MALPQARWQNINSGIKYDARAQNEAGSLFNKYIGQFAGSLQDVENADQKEIRDTNQYNKDLNKFNTDKAVFEKQENESQASEIFGAAIANAKDDNDLSIISEDLKAWGGSEHLNQQVVAETLNQRSNQFKQAVRQEESDFRADETHDFNLAQRKRTTDKQTQSDQTNKDAKTIAKDIVSNSTNRYKDGSFNFESYVGQYGIDAVREAENLVQNSEDDAVGKFGRDKNSALTTAINDSKPEGSAVIDGTTLKEKLMGGKFQYTDAEANTAVAQAKEGNFNASAPERIKNQLGIIRDSKSLKDYINNSAGVDPRIMDSAINRHNTYESVIAKEDNAAKQAEYKRIMKTAYAPGTKSNPIKTFNALTDAGMDVIDAATLMESVVTKASDLEKLPAKVNRASFDGKMLSIQDQITSRVSGDEQSEVQQLYDNIQLMYTHPKKYKDAIAAVDKIGGFSKMQNSFQESLNDTHWYNISFGNFNDSPMSDYADIIKDFNITVDKKGAESGEEDNAGDGEEEPDSNINPHAKGIEATKKASDAFKKASAAKKIEVKNDILAKLRSSELTKLNDAEENRSGFVRKDGIFGTFNYVYKRLIEGKTVKKPVDLKEQKQLTTLRRLIEANKP